MSGRNASLLPRPEGRGRWWKGAVLALALPVIGTGLRADERALKQPSLPVEAPRLSIPGADRSLERPVWVPKTIGEGKLASAMDLAYELERLRQEVVPERNPNPRAPSPVLLQILEASHREAKRQEQEQSLRVASGLGGPQEAPRLGTSLPPSSASGSQNRGSDPRNSYLAVASHGPFHVFDSPGKTILIDLDGKQVGRVKAQGKEWSWLQLESGLMGVMRNQYLRPATDQEVMEFRSHENASGPAPANDPQIGVSIPMNLDLDSQALPVQSEAGAKGHGQTVNVIETMTPATAKEALRTESLR